MKHLRVTVLLATAVAGFAACANSNGNVLSSGGTGGGATGLGGAAVACPACLQDSNCATGSLCGQFGGDQYCAPNCASATCSEGRTCTAVAGANGNAYHLCVPTTNVCGGTTSTSSGGTGGSPTTSSTSSSSSSTTSGSDTCAHSPCTAGAALATGCDGCATTVCGEDSYCCKTAWDASCVTEAMAACGANCAVGSSSSSSSSSGTATMGPPGTVGPGGGSLAALSFAIVGDTRPPNEDDTSGYPTAVITKIYQDIQAANPRPAFAVATGDYQFASPSHTPGTQAAQIGLYMGARANFSNVLFPAMGNHECDGATADNCYACGSACSNVGGTCVNNLCETPNFSVFQSNMLAPLSQALPYYTINVNSTSNAWTAKFVFVACNMWSPAQATWLDSALSTPTTYTFVVRHESPGTSTVPCVTASPSADSITTSHPFTLIIAGHTHTYAYYASEKLVVVGNGGAPLSGSVDYGYVLANQQANGSIVFNEYDYSTNAVTNSFTVQ